MSIKTKLEEAKRNKNRYLTNTVRLVVLLTLAGIVVLFVISSLNSKISTESVSVEDALPEAPNQFEPEQGNGAQSMDGDNGSEEKYREQYLEAVSQYKNDIAPALDNIDFEKWKTPDSSRIDELFSSALTHFGQSDYKTAYDNVTQANEMALSLLSESKDKYNDAMVKALAAYGTDDYESALLHVNNALMFNISSSEANELLKKVEKLPEIMTLLEQAHAARIENNNEKELKFISEIISLSPDRTAAVKRKEELVKVIRANRFSQKLNRAYDLLEEKNVEKPRQILAELKKGYPDRKELDRLADEIDQVEKGVKLENYKMLAEAATSKDDWKSAAGYYKKIMMLLPGDINYAKHLKQAENIVSLSGSLQNFISNPYRLSGAGYSEKARTTISESRKYSDKSQRLQQQASELEDLIQKTNTKREISIVSDNKTHISVRGVGIVGKTDSKIIQLLPGDYLFEGKRDGYKSKLLEVHVPYEGPSDINLTIICDEKT